MRVFVAFPLPPSFTRSLIEETADARRDRVGFRWIPEQHMHITLAFLGETSGADLPLIVDAARTTAARTETFEIAAVRLIALPKHSFARVIAARLEDGGACALAARRFEEELSSHAAAAPGSLLRRNPDRRTFTAHATIARLGNPSVLRGTALDATLGARATIGSLAVYESTLGREGARYRRLQVFPLSAHE